MNRLRTLPPPKIAPAKLLAMAIVDPDAPTRRAFAAWVRCHRGIRCAGVHECAESAVAALPAEKPDIVLLEPSFSGRHDLKSLQWLKPRLPRTHFFIYTDSLDPDHVFTSLATGASGYFLKRTPLHELLPAIQKTTSGEFPSRDQVALRVIESFRHGVATPAALRLPRRQQQVLDLLLQGRTNHEIAAALQVGFRTVCTHVQRIFKKLNVRSRAQAVACVTQMRDIHK